MITQRSNPTNEGQKVWFDYKGKGGSQQWCRGTSSVPCFEAVVLPDGTTRFKYNEQNALGYPTKVTTTYSSNNVVAHRSLTFSYAANNIDLITTHGPGSELLSSNAYNSAHQILTHYNAAGDLTTYTYDAAGRLTSVKSPAGLTTTNLYATTGSSIGWPEKTIDIEIGRTNSFSFFYGELYSLFDLESARALDYLCSRLARTRDGDTLREPESDESMGSPWFGQHVE